MTSVQEPMTVCDASVILLAQPRRLHHAQTQVNIPELLTHHQVAVKFLRHSFFLVDAGPADVG